jgi:signal transduction histidine kinase
MVGEIAIAKKPGDPLTPTESALLADLAAQAGPALSNVRLALDLRTQADELRASRQRIVTAHDAERRRLERNIHDGAQHHLVAIAVNRFPCIGVGEQHDSSRKQRVMTGQRSMV